MSKTRPGKVVHDSRGTAVWDWAVTTGVLAKKSIADLISTLDEPGALSVEADTKATRDWSGDPYNRSAR